MNWDLSGMLSDMKEKPKDKKYIYNVKACAQKLFLLSYDLAALSCDSFEESHPCVKEITACSEISLINCIYSSEQKQLFLK